MRIVFDYRPALRDRSGVGEYVHQLARAFRRHYPGDALTLFTSSLKDRPAPELRQEVPGARVSDHRIPGQVLNLIWHRLEWPAIESCLGASCDLAFSPHPLLLPARDAAQVVMIHDLDFLRHPERTHREIRRDYPRLAGPHARRAHRVIVPSHYTAGEVRRLLGVAADRVAVCPPGVPEWHAPRRGFDRHGYVLFMGTLEPRKNLSTLLDAYTRLVSRRDDVPTLVIVGQDGPDAAAVAEAMSAPPLAGRVARLGYIPDADRQRTLEGARVLVLPSLEEGFGMPALEAMSLGVPVVVSRCGGLPELVGEAGLLVAPADPDAMAHALDRVLTDDTLAAALASRGVERARGYSWQRTAADVRHAFAEALAVWTTISRSAARSRTDRRRAPETATTQSGRPHGPEGSVPHPIP